MANDLEILAVDLKQYTVNLLNSILRDVDDQFDKWAKPKVGFLDKLTGAHSAAADRQVAVLKDQDEERRRAFERSLFIIQLLGVGATSWLGATLELKAGPKIFFEYDTNVAVVLPKNWLRKLPNEFDSKIFGDMSKDLSGVIIDLAGDKVKPEEFKPEEYREPNAKYVVYSPDAATFGQKFYEEVEAQHKLVSTTISRLTQAASKSATFGNALVARLQKQLPHWSRLGLSGLRAEGYKMIDALFAAKRDEWLAKWFYYRCDPPKSDWGKVSKEFERRMWAVWIMQQIFHSQEITDGVYWIVGASGDALNTSGGFGSTIKDSPIVTRLFEEFNAPVQQILVKGSLEKKEDVKQQVDLINKWAHDMKPDDLRDMLEGKKRPVKPINALFE